MNQLRAETLPSEYCRDPHLVITIDGEPLDALILRHSGDPNLFGLVPAMLPWLRDPKERQVVWRRMLPPADCRLPVPVLICPDDVDLYCSVVIADIELAAEVVTWHRLGLDTGLPDGMPDSIGSKVDWFEGLGPFQFPRDDYFACVHQFWIQLSGEQPAV